MVFRYYQQRDGLLYWLQRNEPLGPFNSAWEQCTWDEIMAESREGVLMIPVLS